MLLCYLGIHPFYHILHNFRRVKSIERVFHFFLVVEFGSNSPITCARGSALNPRASCNHSLTYLQLIWLLRTTLLEFKQAGNGSKIAQGLHSVKYSLLHWISTFFIDQLSTNQFHWLTSSIKFFHQTLDFKPKDFTLVETA